MSSIASSLPAGVGPDEPRSLSISAAAVYDRCARSLYRYFVVRLGGDTHLADDFMQQTWAHALSGRSPAAVVDAERWLFGIARNLVRTHWRRRAQRPAAVPIADPLQAAALADQLLTHDLGSAELEQAETRAQLLLALTQLPHEEQELLVAHYFRGRAQADIAAELGISVRAVEGRMYRARQELRKQLSALED